MKSIAVVLLVGLCYTVKGSLLSELYFGDADRGDLDGLGHEKLPDKDLDFERWMASGIYRLRLHRHVKKPHRETFDDLSYAFQPTADADEEDDDTEMRVSMLETYRFTKVYDEKMQAVRVEAHPITYPRMDADAMGEKRRSRPVGTFVLWVHKDDAYLITERTPSEPGRGREHMDDVQCHRLPVKFQKKKSPLHKADYDGLDFADDRLCHRYVNLHMEDSMEDEHGKCELDHSELYIDVFDREPVELFLDGTVRRQGGKSDFKFTIDVTMDEFSYEIDDEDEKSLKKLPHTVKELCQRDAVAQGPLDEDMDAMVATLLHAL